MVWGGRRLGTDLGKPLPTNERFGESWEVSDHALHRSSVAVGEHAGRSIRDLMNKQRVELLGRAADRFSVFPWLVKFLDAADWLSVQVHPNEEQVHRLWPGESGKTEAWFVLGAQPESRIYAGLRPGVDERRLREALQQGKVADCLHSYEPRPGDCLFLPASTVHAVGGGVLMAEVQQTSDATFRLFDWNRRDAAGNSRPLHIEESLACIDWQRGPVEPIRNEGFPSFVGRHNLVACPFFQIELIGAREVFTCDGRQLTMLLVLHGQGRLSSPGFQEPIRRGEVWVLPAALGHAECRPEPELVVLRVTLP
jgi:mannose-6-phosphate isomerase